MRQEKNTLLGGCLGLACFLLIFGIDVINPQNIAWLMAPDNQDAVQHLVGWEFFRNEPWHVPLGLIQNYGYPINTSIVYTDSIPILALIFKCFSPWLSKDFQYFGLWFAVCFFLQGLFSWALSGYISKNNWIKCYITLFFLLSPILCNRLIEHQSLTAHWVILAGFWLYIRPYQHNTNWLWLLLNITTVFIHAYLSFMVLMLWMAFVWRQLFIDSHLSFYTAIRWLIINLVSMIMVAWLCGYFVIPLGHVMNVAGYNTNAMNLWAPFRPSSGAMIVPGHWSPFITPFQPKYIGQGDEGFNYLGIGMLFLLTACIYNLMKHPLSKKSLRPWAPILCVCLVMSIYALSNTVYLGQKLLFSYPLPHVTDFITSTLRASGRFFWPAYYLLMLFVFFSIRRQLNNPQQKQRYIAIMAMALLLQATDVSTKVVELRKLFSFATQKGSVQKALDGLKSDYSHMVFIPAVPRPDRTINQFAQYIHYAAQHHMSVNLGYFARQDTKNYLTSNQASVQGVLQGKLSQDTLYVILNPYIAYRLKSRLTDPNRIVAVGKYSILYRKNVTPSYTHSA